MASSSRSAVPPRTLATASDSCIPAPPPASCCAQPQLRDARWDQERPEPTTTAASASALAGEGAYTSLPSHRPLTARTAPTLMGIGSLSPVVSQSPSFTNVSGPPTSSSTGLCGAAHLWLLQKSVVPFGVAWPFRLRQRCCCARLRPAVTRHNQLLHNTSTPLRRSPRGPTCLWRSTSPASQVRDGAQSPSTSSPTCLCGAAHLCPVHLSLVPSIVAWPFRLRQCCCCARPRPVVARHNQLLRGMSTLSSRSPRCPTCPGMRRSSSGLRWGTKQGSDQQSSGIMMWTDVLCYSQCRLYPRIRAASRSSRSFPSKQPEEVRVGRTDGQAWRLALAGRDQASEVASDDVDLRRSSQATDAPDHRRCCCSLIWFADDLHLHLDSHVVLVPRIASCAASTPLWKQFLLALSSLSAGQSVAPSVAGGDGRISTLVYSSRSQRNQVACFFPAGVLDVETARHRLCRQYHLEGRLLVREGGIRSAKQRHDDVDRPVIFMMLSAPIQAHVASPLRKGYRHR